MTSAQVIASSEAGKPVVFQRAGHAWTNSRDVATCFERSHGHVMRTVRSLIATEPTLGQSTFGLAEYVDEQGKSRPSYDMDRDGFVLVAMEFNGSKAVKFKIAYIAEFNRMEAALHAPAANDDAPGTLREFPHWPMDEIRAKRGVVEMYRMTYGPLSAQWMVPQLGFPVPPDGLIEIGRQLRLALEGLPPHPASHKGAA